MSAETSPPRFAVKDAEERWQSLWETRECFVASDDRDKPKYYVLEMVPLPIGPHSHGTRAQLHDG